jgi:hypothetical protein
MCGAFAPSCLDSLLMLPASSDLLEKDDWREFIKNARRHHNSGQ